MVVLSVLLIVLGGLLAQQAHYKHILSQETVKDNQLLSAELESKLKKLDELEKKINSLSLKMGFKA